MKRILLFLVPIIALASCEFLEPRPSQYQTDEELWSHATYGEGVLITAYTSLETSYPVNMDYYTDNAVPSQPGLNNLAMGIWTVENSPIGNWNTCYNNIRYLNIYIDNGEELVYSVSDQVSDSILKAQRIGEAYFLRAWYQWQLLQAYAGYPDAGSEALGFPVVTEVLDLDDDLDLPRNSYEECVQQIISDCDRAYAVLPLMYNQGNDVFAGTRNRGRASGLAALALKARVYLNAASPAYGNSDQSLWERAAQAAYVAIDSSGGLTPLDEYGNFNDENNFDYIWIQPSYIGLTRESNYFPPSLYGSGLCNPSQNLVDVFPAADGYPIDQSPLYDPDNPYQNRDPRFYTFIFYNGDIYKGTTIETFQGGADAPGGLNQQGTRSGYYMKKFLSNVVNLTPGEQFSDVKFYVFLGRTELYLNFAEAANEAYGPNDARLGFSAADAMRMIRIRAGLDQDTAAGYQDPYLDEQAAAGKDSFRNFIQNNRRIELCFEGFRFWDIRRLNLPLNHTVRGVIISENGENYSYQYVDLENHTFQEFMRYAPLPYSQTLIMNNLEQNSGW